MLFAIINKDGTRCVAAMLFCAGATLFWVLATRVLRNFDGDQELRRHLSGKSDEGQPLRGAHDHAFYLLWPDEDSGSPARLIVWRRGEPFQKDEIDAMMLAVAKPIP